MRTLLRKMISIWNRWDPQPTWQEVVRLTAIESALALSIIWVGELLF